MPIKRTGLFFMLMAFSLFLKSGANPDFKPLPSLTMEQIQTIIDHASGERALDDIRHLSLLHRWFNSDGYDEAANYVLNKTKEIGLAQAGIEKFPADGKILYSTQRTLPRWNVKEAELAMTSPQKKRLVSWEETPTVLASNSRSADVEAELVDVGEGVRPSDYEGKDIKGKFVLASSPQAKGRIEVVHRLAVLERGAAGVVSYRSYYLDDFPDLITWDHIWTLEKDGRPSTFGFCVSKRMGWELRRLLRDGEKVVLKAKVETSLGPGEYGVVQGSIPGTVFPDQEIWLIAHLDHANPGANDNASGSAAILESARAFSRLIKAGLVPKPKRTIRFLWVPEIYGTTAYLATHPEAAERIIAVINMDMVGEDQKLCGSTFQVTRTPDSTPSFLNDILSGHLDFFLAHPPEPGHEMADPLAVISPLGSREPWLAAVAPFSGGSDHEVFMGGGVNIPATMFGSGPDYFYHTAQDTPDKCDSTQLRRAIALAMTVASSLAYLDAESAQEQAEILFSKSLGRLGSDVERSMGFLQRSPLRGEDLKEALNILDGGARREIQVISSLMRRVPLEKKQSSLVRRKIDELDLRLETDKKTVRISYGVLCAERGVKPGPAVLTPEETDAGRFIPRRKPGFPGPFDDGYLGEKLGAEGKAALGRLPGLASYETGAYIDGKLSALDIRNAVSAECGPVNLSDVMAYLRALESIGLISLEKK